MSYCRFGEADAYVFLSCDGHLECCGCYLPSETSRYYTTADLLAHLADHRDIPDDVVAELEADRQENDAWIGEEQAEHQAEIERELVPDTSHSKGE